ncbi:transcription initiation factor TFIID subunit 11-like isoform X2 [Megalobrama amblycephala]|uniref:transcription initiation factor TFIID subunit 11-like isoform X2 n=1 Tax=Megalobrama amblycephala TaxID=75352 RepID=UPI002014621B|nr:transcription initiation factor TFIID subunit 11-like isoform X2 [Megalobrama amblycephala]
MNGFFTILATLVIAGVVSAREEVEGRWGEKIVLLDEKSGFNFSRVALYELSTDCEQLRREIFNYCSAKEKESGCAEKSCSTFSFDIGEKSVSVTPLNNASDGCYRAKIFANDVVEKTLIIKANGPLLSTPSPESDPPSWEPTESYSTKGRDPPETESYSTKATDPPETNGMSWGTAVGIAVGIAAVIAVVIPGVILICRRCKKNKHKQSEAGDDAGDSEENNSHRESISGGEQTTGESFRMEDGILRSADEDSLSEVLIDNTSTGQESGRPGQHVQHNNYRDFENYCNRKNKNDYEDSNDDSNYYSNDDSKNIPNSGGDDDDDDDNSDGGDDDDDENSGGGSDDDDDDSGGDGDDNDCNKPLKW